VDTLAAERIVLDGAHSALVRHDASGALVALRSHERAFPRGQLLEERESMRVQALSLAHDSVAAQAAGERFRRHFPRSMFLPAVDQALEALP
jgi:outer membrane protein assembly factor BamD (BamD/ComL family)